VKVVQLKPSQLPAPMRALSRQLAVLTLSLLFSGCTTLGLTADRFSQTVDPEVRKQVLDSVQLGMPMDNAESKIIKLGFQCSTGHGSFVDEHGHEHSASTFLSCVRRPPRFSFSCENRDQVYVIPNGGMADEIHVTRGPSCLDQTDPGR
jgi:hypothetical protein